MVHSKTSKKNMISSLDIFPINPKIVANNTLRYFTKDGNKVIRHHKTDILTFYNDGSFKVNTGGWNTVTTRARINKFLPFGYGVSTKKGTLYFCANGEKIAFEDYIIVSGHE